MSGELGLVHALGYRLLNRLLGVKCPICRNRTRCLRVHINVNHTRVRP